MMTHTVLVVEDEVDLREMLQEALELSGYAVVAVADGRAALDAMARIESLCLVLLDLLMPGMNGWDFCDHVRKRPELARLPIIVHSSATNSPPRGATAVVRKPVKLDRLLSIVGEHCDPSVPAPKGSS
jgi:two-component system, chemotaxis family, chemotaxis protein CheY